MILNLTKLDSEFIHDENTVHFRELQDNINEASELTDSYREILYDQLSIYHSSMSTKLNEIMRVLTIISVIFIPITFIVGVYGTNFINVLQIVANRRFIVYRLVPVLNITVFSSFAAGTIVSN